jgi:hypothetical protein
MEPDRKVLLEAAHGEAAAQEFRYPPMGKKRNLQDAVDKSEPLRQRAEALVDFWVTVCKRKQSNVQAGLLDPLQSLEQRE